MCENEPVYAKMNLHGLHFEYVWNSDKMFHWIAGIHAGFGNFEYSVESGGGNWDKDWVYFATPSAAIEVNLVTWMRVDVGASYHVITGFDLDGLSAGEFGGPNAMVKLKFGSF